MKSFFTYLSSKNHKNKGYTLLETVVYVSIFSVVIFVTFLILFSITRAFAEARIYNEVEVSGTTAMERITRELRTATSADILADVGTGDSGIQLNTTAEDGTAKTIKFYFDESAKTVNIIDGGADKGSLTGNGVSVTNLDFYKWVTPKGSLIKIEITVQSNRKTTLKENYYDSIVLRGAY